MKGKLIILALGLTCLSQATFGPVAWWKLDETSGSTAVDSIGGVNGTLQGSDAFISGGISNNALSNPGGAGNYLTTADAFPFITHQFSVSAWIRTIDTSSASNTILGKAELANNNGWALRINSDSHGVGQTGKASFWISSSQEPISTITVTDGAWHHLLGEYDGTSTLSLYVDGQFQGSVSGNGGPNINSAPFSMGGVFNNGAMVNTYNGDIDDVQIYDRAVSAEEANFLFQHPGSPVPEPATLAVLVAGSIGVLRRRRKSR